MTWVYSQSSGNLSQNGIWIGEGYSGCNLGRNNAQMQNVPDVGPIPQGEYIIGPAHDEPILGPCVMNLDPLPSTNTFGRSLFRIHGNNAQNDASHGCIILGPLIRKQISESWDTDLLVISGNSDKLSSTQQEIPMTNIFTEVWDEIKTWFNGTVVPDAEKAASAVEAVAQTWLSQFETDFGKAALAAAISAVASFATGGFPAVPAIAEAAGKALVAQGLSIAEQDAQTVLLNAARTALNSATAQTSAAYPDSTT